MLPNGPDESFVCDLSSMNAIYYDEWKDTDAVETLVYLLDAVMTDFIEKAKKVGHFERAVRFAERHRALGVGILGWHSYLQSRMIPFESLQAKGLNVQIVKTIRTQADAASRNLAQEYGEPELLKGYGRRNTTLLAVAPTKSSAFILGQASETVEPERGNHRIDDLAKGKFTIKNKYLEALLESKGYNTDAVWDSIMKKGGSVQHIDILTPEEKAVFKTISEISPKEIIIQAAARQKYIDQGQSLNLFIHPSIPAKDVNALMIEAWRLGIKSLYYQKNVNAAQEFARNILDCASCSA
jgi:ribonucleoside-diphosphate reductase alpha chain